jgi:hydroxyethylthiazole kinase
MSEPSPSVADTLAEVRTRNPLVHSITNLVAMDLGANVLLAVGASPVMAHAREEIDEIVAVANALVVNIGTLDAGWVESMEQAAAKASELGTPWVLDPVGVGATTYRNEVAARLTALQPTVIRGNGSEIVALAGAANVSAATRGVDSAIDSAEALDAARDLAQASQAIVAVTGSVDYVTDGTRVIAVANGVPEMAQVTAMGCALTGLIGACIGAGTEPLRATAHALAIYGVAGEIAAQHAHGPGSLRMRMLDAFTQLDSETLNEMASIDQ